MRRMSGLEMGIRGAIGAGALIWVAAEQGAWVALKLLGALLLWGIVWAGILWAIKRRERRQIATVEERARTAALMRSLTGGADHIYGTDD